MDVIIGERGSGRSTELIKRSADTGTYIVVPNMQRAYTLFSQAMKLGYAIPFPVTIKAHHNCERFIGSSLRIKDLLIDDTEEVTRWNKYNPSTLTYAEKVYDIVKYKSEGRDAIYEDYIVELVGIMGLKALKEHRLIETCGVVKGRQLYTLMSKN